MPNSRNSDEQALLDEVGDAEGNIDWGHLRTTCERHDPNLEVYACGTNVMVEGLLDAVRAVGVPE